MPARDNYLGNESHADNFQRAINLMHKYKGFTDSDGLEISSEPAIRVVGAAFGKVYLEPYNVSDATMYRLTNSYEIPETKYFAPGLLTRVPHIAIDAATFIRNFHREINEVLRQKAASAEYPLYSILETTAFDNFLRVRSEGAVEGLLRRLETLKDENKRRAEVRHDREVTQRHLNSILEGQTLSGRRLLDAIAEQLHNKAEASAAFDKARADRAQRNIERLERSIPERPRTYTEGTIPGVEDNFEQFYSKARENFPPSYIRPPAPG